MSFPKPSFLFCIQICANIFLYMYVKRKILQQYIKKASIIQIVIVLNAPVVCLQTWSFNLQSQLMEQQNALDSNWFWSSNSIWVDILFRVLILRPIDVETIDRKQIFRSVKFRHSTRNASKNQQKMEDECRNTNVLTSAYTAVCGKKNIMYFNLFHKYTTQ